MLNFLSKRLTWFQQNNCLRAHRPKLIQQFEKTVKILNSVEAKLQTAPQSVYHDVLERLYLFTISVTSTCTWYLAE